MKETLSIPADQGEQLASRGDCLVASGRDSLEEEVRPRLPVSAAADFAQQPVVFGPMALEEETQVEQWCREQLPVLEQKRDQQTPNAPIAVEVRVDGLELDVRQADSH